MYYVLTIRYLYYYELKKYILEKHELRIGTLCHCKCGALIFFRGIVRMKTFILMY